LDCQAGQSGTQLVNDAPGSTCHQRQAVLNHAGRTNRLNDEGITGRRRQQPKNLDKLLRRYLARPAQLKPSQ